MISRRSLLAGGAATLLPLPTLSLAETGDGWLDLKAGPAARKLYTPDGPDSPLWTYNGQVPGPEIRLKRGERVKVRFTNELTEPTSIHWHGIRIDNAMDGVAGLTQAAVAPGESFTYDFVVPDAGTYWYHAHNKSWNQVGRGLYGPLIVDEEQPAFDRAHDLTLVVDDWRLVQPGILDTESFGALMDWAHGGRLGNWITVNGVAQPKLRLKRGETYRLRLINAANARVFEIDPNRFGAKVLAYDGQPLREPATLPYAPALLGPAQRMDLLVKAEEDFVIEELSTTRPFPLVGFAATAGETASNAAPAVLPLAPNAIAEPDLAGARRVKVVMQGGAMGGPVDITYNGKRLEGEDFPRTRQSWAFNGIANLAKEPLFAAEPGETIVIETVNLTSWVHAMHVHGHHFRVLSRSGSEIDEDQPWRDTFLIGPEQTTEIAFVADNRGKWLYHCHMLEHAAAGMTTWFDVS
ncbi:multicopper oxidase family protein [Pseudohoeflea sp. DP4N28-3]|uniref:Multicopper oxidase family protein n=2 Tax=Pseudohoeflea coraliihabitans TaxID=2860393 RepID=A0ABS6WSP7_9HYPH|nr:multicopper oxidase family protein [Pseudohoeflea sp. DP4N28-3]